MRIIHVTLPDGTYRALRDLADRELRSPRAQATVLLIDMLRVVEATPGSLSMPHPTFHLEVANGITRPVLDGPLPRTTGSDPGEGDDLD